MLRVDFDVYLITDRRQCEGGDLVAAVEKALRGGVRAVQLREKDLSTRERFKLGRQLRRLTSEFGAKLLVNGDAALARAVGADGVHLPQGGLRVDVCRRVLEPGMIAGVSTHSLLEAQEAAGKGADFITFGPVFPTPSKAKYGPPTGVASLSKVCASVELPVFALGGVGAANMVEVLLGGASGIAMISAILAAPDVEAAASEIVQRLRQARSAQSSLKERG